jgi:hypothetical protein
VDSRRSSPVFRWQIARFIPNKAHNDVMDGEAFIEEAGLFFERLG